MYIVHVSLYVNCTYVMDSGIGPNSSVSKSVHTVSRKAWVQFQGQPHILHACYRSWCSDNDLMSCLWFEQLWGRTRDLLCVFLFPGLNRLLETSGRGGGVRRTRVSDRLAQLVRTSARLVGGPGFDSQVGHNIYLPFTHISI